jgi:hypothetical protein
VRKVLMGPLVLILGLGMTSSAEGQVAIGAKGGINIADVAIEADGADEPTNSRTGVLAAGVVAYTVHPWLSFQLEGRYSQQGAVQPQGDGIDALLRLSYAEVPLTAKLLLPTGGIVRPYLYAGGFASFEVACSLMAVGMGVSLDIGCDEAQDRGKSDYGVIFGAGSDFAVGPGAVTLDVEYAVGLRDISDNLPGTAYHRVLSIAAGFKVFL